MTTNYHYIVMSQKDLLQNQVLEEVLREKASYYNARKKNPDFWILIDPSFLYEKNLIKKIENTRFYNQQKDKIHYSFSNLNNNSSFYGSLISTDEEFMRWIKLRLGYFENLDEINKNNNNASYVSDGVFGILKSTETKEILKSNKNYLHPDILLNKLKNSLEQYFNIIKN